MDLQHHPRIRYLWNCQEIQFSHGCNFTSHDRAFSPRVYHLHSTSWILRWCSEAPRPTNNLEIDGIDISMKLAPTGHTVPLWQNQVLFWKNKHGQGKQPPQHDDRTHLCIRAKLHISPRAGIHQFLFLFSFTASSTASYEIALFASIPRHLLLKTSHT